MFSKPCSSTFIGKWNRAANKTQQLKRRRALPCQIGRTWNLKQQKMKPYRKKNPDRSRKKELEPNLNQCRLNTFLFHTNIPLIPHPAHQLTKDYTRYINKFLFSANITGSELGVEIFTQGVKAGQAFCVSFDNLNHRLLRGKLLKIRFLVNL